MVRNVLSVFKPRRFVLTMFGDEAAIESILELPTDPRKIVLSHGAYNRTSLSSSKVELELVCIMSVFMLDPGGRMTRSNSGNSLTNTAAATTANAYLLAEAAGGATSAPFLSEKDAATAAAAAVLANRTSLRERGLSLY